MKTIITASFLLLLTSCAANSTSNTTTEANSEFQTTSTTTTTTKEEVKAPVTKPTLKDKITSCTCVKMWMPVCGENKKTYGNSCEADCAGVKYTNGECKKMK
jgi:hypothetical protein